jgi:hypothetical protein
MKRSLIIVLLVLFSISTVQADSGKATPQDVYELVLKAYEVVKTFGDEALEAFNDPKGEFVYKDTYAYVLKCPSEMAAHPFAMEKLRGVDLNTFSFTAKSCEAASKSQGEWVEYMWPKPGEEKPSRKIVFAIGVEGTPYQILAGIYNDTASIEELNSTLQ